MKKFLFVILTVIFFAGSQLLLAQDESQAGAPENDIKNSVFYRIQKGIYNRARKYNDINMAINALYHLTLMDAQNDSLLFSLAYIYFDNQKYVSAVLVLNDVLLLNPDNLTALEMKAVSLEQVGAKDRALDEYESLYLKSDDNIRFLYKIAVLQYELKRYSEARTNIDILLSKSEIEEINYYFPDSENNEQEIPLRASLHNLKGLVAKDLGNTEEAKKQFGLALEIAPDFFLAQENLKDVRAN